MQRFSNPIIATNENIIIWAVLSFEEEYTVQPVLSKHPRDNSDVLD